jgi:prepilin-type processing-associated H-X9-DG protein
MYADNYNGYFPSENTSGTAGIDKGWADNVAPYIGMEGKYNASYRPRYGANSILSCPSLQNNNSYSDYLLCQLFWAYWNGGSNPWAAYNNIKKMKAPSSKGILVDSEFYSFFNYTTAKIGIKGVMISAARLRLLHLNGFNILYCDGHSTWQAGEIGDDLQDIFDASK